MYRSFGELLLMLVFYAFLFHFVLILHTLVFHMDTLYMSTLGFGNKSISACLFLQYLVLCQVSLHTI